MFATCFSGRLITGYPGQSPQDALRNFLTGAFMYVFEVESGKPAPRQLAEDLIGRFAPDRGDKNLDSANRQAGFDAAKSNVRCPS